MRVRNKRSVRMPDDETAHGSGEAALPAAADIDRCRRCNLWRRATQGVAGEGAIGAEALVIGEQPGDVEDRTGRPFVGPSGRLLDQLLGEAGFDRQAIYVTNAVKHFKWEPRGKRRLHRRPSAGEIDACQPWLEQEILAVRPRVIIVLGATAARSLLGRAVSIDSHRGRRLVHRSGARIFVTYHPSAVLRADEAAKRLRGRLLHDLKRAAEALSDPSP